MTFGAALHSLLTASATLVAAVPATRITPWPLPQNQRRPAITYSFTSGNVAYAFGVDPNIFQPRVQFDVWADTFTESEQIAKILRTRIRNYQGTHADTTSAITFQGSYLESEPTHLFEYETALHRLTFDATFHYSETAV